MEELTEVITASEFHPKECNLFVYSSSKGTIRLCDMRQVGGGEEERDSLTRVMFQSALCDSHTKMFEEPEDPTNRSFFSEIISSISDVKFSNSGRYMISRLGSFQSSYSKCQSFINSSPRKIIQNIILLLRRFSVHEDSHKPSDITFIAGTISPSRSGTCTWRPSPLRRTQCTSTSGLSFARCMRTTASSTSSRWRS